MTTVRNGSRKFGRGNYPTVAVPATVCDCQHQHSSSENYLPVADAVAEPQNAAAPVNSQSTPTVTVVSWTETTQQTDSVAGGQTKAVTQAAAQLPPIPTAPIPSRPAPPSVQQQAVLQPIPTCEECVPCGEVVCLPPAIHTQQINALMVRVANMEKQLKRSNSSIVTLRNSLTQANQEVKRLNASVTQWQGEVKRLEAAMQSQHEADIASLTRITDMLGSLVETELAESDAKEVQQ